ncbi:MAG: hypothetical protein HZB41_11035 [Ignavibacteriae bacterium]|nr:hypothetical protein [Ignavibacteriota bacterium]
MRKIKYLLSIIPILLLSSCLVTLNTLFEPKDYIQFDSILGKWGTLDSNKVGSYWEFVQQKCDSNENCISYNLVHYEVSGSKAGDTVNFFIGIGKIGKSYFMEISPNDITSSTDKTGIEKIDNSFYKMHILRANTIHKINILNDTLLLLGINNVWYENNVLKGRVKLSHVSRKNAEEEIITASTMELKKFAKKFAEHKEVFTDTLMLVKLK